MIKVICLICIYLLVFTANCDTALVFGPETVEEVPVYYPKEWKPAIKVIHHKMEGLKDEHISFTDTFQTKLKKSHHDSFHCHHMSRNSCESQIPKNLIENKVPKLPQFYPSFRPIYDHLYYPKHISQQLNHASKGITTSPVSIPIYISSSNHQPLKIHYDTRHIYNIVINV